MGLRELSGLSPPAALAVGWRKMLGYRAVLLGELGELVRAASANDVAAIQRLAVSKARAHKALQATAERNGFKECGLVG